MALYSNGEENKSWILGGMFLKLSPKALYQLLDLGTPASTPATCVNDALSRLPICSTTGISDEEMVT